MDTGAIFFYTCIKCLNINHFSMLGWDVPAETVQVSTIQYKRRKCPRIYHGQSPLSFQLLLIQLTTPSMLRRLENALGVSGTVLCSNLWYLIHRASLVEVSWTSSPKVSHDTRVPPGLCLAHCRFLPSSHYYYFHLWRQIPTICRWYTNINSHQQGEQPSSFSQSIEFQLIRLPAHIIYDWLVQLIGTKLKTSQKHVCFELAAGLSH